jgi:hypothetical protein
MLEGISKKLKNLHRNEFISVRLEKVGVTRLFNNVVNIIDYVGNT